MIISANAVYNMDCRDGMALMKPGTVDIFVTDPPFALKFKAKKANYNRTSSNVLDGYVEIPEEDYAQFTKEWIRLARRALKDGGCMYIFSGDQGLHHILNMLSNYGFEFRQLIWNYPFGVYAKNNYVMAHYNLVYAWKKGHKPKLKRNSRYKTTREQYHDMQSVWHIKREYWTGKEKTPTKLPTEIIKKILQYSSKKNDIVCDPFNGSGQVAFTARKLGRRFIAFEIVKNYFDFTVKRFVQPEEISVIG